MNYFLKKRLVFWGIILLVVMNLSSLATVWWQKHMRPGPPPGGMDEPRRARHILKKELGLTDSQSKQFERIQHQHRRNSEEIHENMKNLKHDLFAQLAVDSIDEDKIEQLTLKIGQAQSELEVLTFRHFLELKNLCNDEQQKRLSSLISELLPGRRPPPPLRRPGGPPPPRKRP